MTTRWTRSTAATTTDGPVFDHPGLRVHAASAAHLLAMKVLAGRRLDAEDIRLLADRLGRRTADEVRAACAEVFPDQPVPKWSELLLNELFQEPSG